MGLNIRGLFRTGECQLTPAGTHEVSFSTILNRLFVDGTCQNRAEIYIIDPLELESVLSRTGGVEERIGDPKFECGSFKAV